MWLQRIDCLPDSYLYYKGSTKGEKREESGETIAQMSVCCSSGLIEIITEVEVMGRGEKNSPDECLMLVWAG